MNKGKKWLIGGGILAAVMGVVAAVAKATGATAEAAPGLGGLTITLYDQYGNVIATSGAVQHAVAAAPVAATEGDTISIGLSATNTSYQMLGGVKTPVAADLTLVIVANAGSVPLIAPTRKALSFGPGASMAVDKFTWSALQFTIPVGSGGQTGMVSAQLLDPNGVVQASGQVSFAIAVAPIIYGGTISFS